MRLDFNACTAAELHDAARACYVFHNETSIGAVRLGEWFHVFDLTSDTETKLDAANTTPERLQAHAVGFVANIAAKAARAAS